MTSLATLILRLYNLTRQSQFHLSRFLGALIHLPRVWRALRVELNLSSLTWKVLQLTRQLRSESLIRIGAPPLLKLAEQESKLQVDETTSAELSIPVDLSRMQDLLGLLGETLHETRDTVPAITRRLFQPVKKHVLSRRLSVASSTTSDRALTREQRSQTPSMGRPLLSGGETQEEEELRELVVEAWLRRNEEAGIRPSLSFAEAHVLYRELFEEFVNTGILPPNLFSQIFSETQGHLTVEQARADLHTRLNELARGFSVSSEQETEEGARALISSPLLPSYIPTALWSKGSLDFGTFTATRTSSLTTESPQRMPSITVPVSPTLTERSLLPESKGPSFSEPLAPHSDLQPFRNLVVDRTSEEAPSRSLMKTEIENYPPNGIHTFKDADESRVHERSPILDENIRGSMSSETHLLTMGPSQAEDLRTYSPAQALISTIVLHSKAAFVWPLAGSRLVTSSTASWKIPRPSVLAKDKVEEDVSGSLSALAQPQDKADQQLERPLTIFESRPVALYLRPTMSLPAVESTQGQRVLPMILPSSNVASTRESMHPEISEQQTQGEEETEELAEEEDMDAENELQKNVKRFGRIIAEEAKRHIGSS